jgi:hypothetical protein
MEDKQDHSGCIEDGNKGLPKNSIETNTDSCKTSKQISGTIVRSLFNNLTK